jgi:hypothetical protein
MGGQRQVRSEEVAEAVARLRVEIGRGEPGRRRRVLRGEVGRVDDAGERALATQHEGALRHDRGARMPVIVWVTVPSSPAAVRVPVMRQHAPQIARDRAVAPALRGQAVAHLDRDGAVRPSRCQSAREVAATGGSRRCRGGPRWCRRRGSRDPP